MHTFNSASFAAFETLDLASRMEKIQETIQPVFLEVGTALKENLVEKLEKEFYLHIAKHLRRTVYPPASTWCALSQSKRGYKMEAHFQLRIDEQGVAFLLSMIDQPKAQKRYGELLQAHLAEIKQLPARFILSKDHTTNQFFPLQENIEASLERFLQVKKSELEIGYYFSKEEVLALSGEAFFQKLEEILDNLLPLYKILLNC